MDVSSSILEKVCLHNPEGKPFFIDVKRDDLIDEIVSGNKWRKLEYNVLQAKKENKKGILTFGGAYSNHLVATAKACYLLGFKSLGIVRGDELNAFSNTTLKTCAHYGMQLLFYARSRYKERYSASFLTALQTQYPSYFMVPEGGKNQLGTLGCRKIVTETPNDYDHIFSRRNGNYRCWRFSGCFLKK